MKLYYTYPTYPDAPKTTKLSRIINKPSVGSLLGIFISLVLIFISIPLYTFIGSVLMVVGLINFLLFYPIGILIFFNKLIGKKLAEKEREKKRQILLAHSDRTCVINGCLFVFEQKSSSSDIDVALKQFAYEKISDFGNKVIDLYKLQGLLLDEDLKLRLQNGFSLYQSKSQRKVLEISDAMAKLYICDAFDYAYLVENSNITELSGIRAFNDFAVFVTNEFGWKFV